MDSQGQGENVQKVIVIKGILEPVEKVQNKDLQAQIQVNKNKAKVYKLVYVLLFLVLVCTGVFLIWKGIKFLGLVYLGFVVFSWMKDIVWKKSNLKNKEMTVRELMSETLRKSNKDIDIGEEEIVRWAKVVKAVLVFLGFLTFFFLLIFALDKNYQFFPMNILGFFSTGLMFFVFCKFAKLNIADYLDKKVGEEDVFWKKCLKWLRVIVVNLYILGLYAKVFGIW